MIDTSSLQNLLDDLTERFLTGPHSNTTRINGSPVELSLGLMMEHTLESAFLAGVTLLIELGQLLLVEDPFPDDFVNRLFGDNALGKMRLSKRTIKEFFREICHLIQGILVIFLGHYWRTSKTRTRHRFTPLTIS